MITTIILNKLESTTHYIVILWHFKYFKF